MLAGVLPPADDLGRVEPARARVVAVHVGDLELSPQRGSQLRDDVEHVRRVAVETDHRVGGRRRVEPRVHHARLLDDVRHAAVAVPHDDAEVLGIVDVLDEDASTRRALGPLGNGRRLRVLEDVVAEHDHERCSGREVPRHADDLGDPARLRLDLVREIDLEDRVAATARGETAVAEQVDHLPRVALAGHEQDVADACELELLQRVVDHRPAAHRQQMLVGDACELAESCRLAARADQALHLHARMLTARCAVLSPLTRAPPRTPGGFPGAHAGYCSNSCDPDVQERDEGTEGREHEALRMEGEEQDPAHRRDRSRHTADRSRGKVVPEWRNRSPR